jgi:hypothetical protein
MRGGGLKQSYLAQLRRFYAEHGRAPTIGECGSGIYRHRRVRSLPACFTLQQHFGSFNNALRAAGIPTRKRGEQITRGPGDRWRAANRRRRKRTAAAPTRRSTPILDPRWHLILAEAREALARRCA